MNLSIDDTLFTKTHHILPHSHRINPNNEDLDVACRSGPKLFSLGGPTTLQLTINNFLSLIKAICAPPKLLFPPQGGHGSLWSPS